MPRQQLLGALLMVFATTQTGLANGFIRELDVYCVAEDGVKTGVAASQDGATLAYIEAAGEPSIMVRTVHSRTTVSAWHAALDLARLGTLRLRTISRPYCAIDRTGLAGNQTVSWPQGETPKILAPVFKAVMDLHGQGF